MLILLFTGLGAHLTENFQEEAVRRLAEEEAERLRLEGVEKEKIAAAEAEAERLRKEEEEKER